MIEKSARAILADVKKHAKDREQVDAIRDRYRRWPTDKLRDHLNAGMLTKEGRTAARHVLAERERAPRHD